MGVENHHCNSVNSYVIDREFVFELHACKPCHTCLLSMEGSTQIFQFRLPAASHQDLLNLSHIAGRKLLRNSSHMSGVWGGGEIGTGCDCNTCSGDHTLNMFGTSLRTNYYKRTIALRTAERMQEFCDHCELLHPMSELLHQKMTIAATPLRNPPEMGRGLHLGLLSVDGLLEVSSENLLRIGRLERQQKVASPPTTPHIIPGQHPPPLILLQCHTVTPHRTRSPLLRNRRTQLSATSTRQRQDMNILPL